MKTVNTTEMSMKDLRLHTLRGDIQSIGMDGYSKRGIRNILQGRFVDPSSETPITKEEFDRILNEEYAKVEAWRAKNR